MVMVQLIMHWLLVQRLQANNSLLIYVMRCFDLEFGAELPNAGNEQQTVTTLVIGIIKLLFLVRVTCAASMNTSDSHLNINKAPFVLILALLKARM